MLETVTSILEKFSTGKTAATLTLASFAILICSTPLLVIVNLGEIAQINEPKMPESLFEAISILTSDPNSKLVTIISTFSIILVISICFLIIESIILLRESLRQSVGETGKILDRVKEEYENRNPDELNKDEIETLGILKISSNSHPFISIFFDLIFYIIFIVVALFFLCIICSVGVIILTEVIPPS